MATVRPQGWAGTFLEEGPDHGPADSAVLCVRAASLERLKSPIPFIHRGPAHLLCRQDVTAFAQVTCFKAQWTELGVLLDLKSVI